METKIISTIQLMQNGEVAHTIKIENLHSYEFIFDSKTGPSLKLITTNLNMKDLNMLFSKIYSSYVLMGVKKVIQDDKTQTYEIPATVFKHIHVKENGKSIELLFSGE